MNKNQKTYEHPDVWAVEELSDDDDRDIEEMQKEVEDILSKITSKKQNISKKEYEPPLQFLVKVEVEEYNEPEPNKPDKSETTNQKLNQQPAKQQPTNQQPVKQQPAKQQPAKQQPANTQLANQQLAKQQPANTQHANQQPAKQQFANQPPLYQQPAKQQFVYQPLANQQPKKHQPTKKNVQTQSKTDEKRQTPENQPTPILINNFLKYDMPKTTSKTIILAHYMNGKQRANDGSQAAQQNQYAISDKFKHYTFTKDDIKAERRILSLLSDNVADRYIEMLAYNVENKPYMSEKTPDQIACQKVLSMWRDWYLVDPINRDTPLMYKCLTCGLAWWHLSEFEEHIEKTHSATNESTKPMKLDFEWTNNESCITARRIGFRCKEVKMNSMCWRCGLMPEEKYKSYDNNTRTYNCRCGSIFGTCTAFRSHQGICKLINLDQKKKLLYRCHMCFTSYETSQDLIMHKTIAHTVRSDLPVAWPKNMCKICRIPCENVIWHDCPGIVQNKLCNYCTKKFSTLNLLKRHEAGVKRNVKCRLCDHVLPMQCMELKHLMEHTDSYKMLYKCEVCEDNKYFLDLPAYNIHLLAKHPLFDELATAVPVPMRCLQRCGYNAPHTKISKMDIPPKVTEVISPQKRIAESLPFNQGNLKTYRKNVKSLNIDDNNKNLIPNGPSIVKIEEENIEEYISSNKEIDDLINIDNKDDKTIDIQIDNIETKENISSNEEINVDCDIKDEVVLSNLEVADTIEIKEEIIDTSDEECTVADFNDLVDDSIKIEVKEEPDEYFEDDIIILRAKEISNFNDVNQDSYDSNANEDMDYGMDDDYVSEDDDEEEGTRTYKRRYTCKKCNFEGTFRKYKTHKDNFCRSSRRRMTMAIDEFGCTKCMKQFRSMKAYLQHLPKHNYPKMSCPDCMTVYENFCKLVPHVSSHISKMFISVRAINISEAMKTVKFNCKQCITEVNPSGFFNHWEQHLKVPEEKLPTSNWETFAPESPALRELIALILGVPYANLSPRDRRLHSCKVCPRSFNRQNECKRHFIEHLLDDAYTKVMLNKGLRCQICGELFSNNITYKSHMRYHASLPVYKCDLCNKSFSDSSNFAKHKKVHNLSVITCDICQKKFSLKFQLIKHMEVHATQKPIKCEVDGCNRILFCKTSYRKHYRQVHDKLLTRFTCHICKERFTALKDKWDHQWQVHKQRKHIADCPICSQPFRKFADVKSHMRLAHRTSYDLKKVNTLTEREKTKNMAHLVDNEVL